MNVALIFHKDKKRQEANKSFAKVCLPHTFLRQSEYYHIQMCCDDAARRFSRELKMASGNCEKKRWHTQGHVHAYHSLVTHVTWAKEGKKEQDVSLRCGSQDKSHVIKKDALPSMTVVKNMPWLYVYRQSQHTSVDLGMKLNVSSRY